MTNTTAAQTIASLKAHAEQKDTETLLGALIIMEQATELTNEERMVKAATSDVITERHGLDDLMETIFVEDLDFTGTYTDAIIKAMEVKAA